MPDGYFQVACEQACPTESIVFGDILDPASRVAATRTSQRSYMLLGYLNTRPRTSHLMRVTNPNPAITTPVDAIAEAHHGGGDAGGHAPAGGDHAAPAGEQGGEHGFWVDPARRGEDRGYALSLNVLGTGVHA